MSLLSTSYETAFTRICTFIVVLSMFEPLKIQRSGIKLCISEVVFLSAYQQVQPS